MSGSGAIAIDTSSAGVTVTAALSTIAPLVAVTVAAPAVAPTGVDASPPAATVIRPGGVPDHVTVFVRSTICPSLIVPVAVNVRVRPSTSVVGSGVTSSETSVAGPTVS
jgi:hypothetical protein